MTADDRLRRAALSTVGLDSIRRPAVPGGADVPEADSATFGEFDLHYARTGPRGVTPVVVIPGGPGLASVWPYRAFRKRAARRGLDVIMVEHRGVGLSRRDLHGNDLRPEAMTLASVVDDLEAVLAAEGVRRAAMPSPGTSPHASENWSRPVMSTNWHSATPCESCTSSAAPTSSAASRTGRSGSARHTPGGWSPRADARRSPRRCRTGWIRPGLGDRLPRTRLRAGGRRRPHL